MCCCMHALRMMLSIWPGLVQSLLCICERAFCFQGHTLLMTASYLGRKKIVKGLLDCGATANAQNDEVCLLHAITKLRT